MTKKARIGTCFNGWKGQRCLRDHALDAKLAERYGPGQLLEVGHWALGIGHWLNVLLMLGALFTWEAVGAPAPTNLGWASGGEAIWFVQTNVTFGGLATAQSGRTSDDGSSSLSARMLGPGQASFWWKVSSEEYFDFLSFYCNDVLQAEISGEVDWREQSFSLPEGTNTLSWVYAKDISQNSGMDAGWVSFPGIATMPPCIVTPPVSEVGLLGSNVTLKAGVLGAPVLSFQWQRNGTNIPGATNLALFFTNVAYADQGDYCLAASNPFGSSTSVMAALRVLLPTALNVWNERQVPSYSDLFDVTRSPDLFVAVGYGGGIFASDDGVTWMNNSVDWTWNLNGVTYANGLYVAVGNNTLSSNSVLLTSTNARHWTLGAVSGDLLGISLREVVFGTNLCVAVGSSGTIVVSPDGWTWSTVMSGPLGLAEDLTSVTFGNGRFVAVGRKDTNELRGIVLYSDDGWNWTRTLSGVHENLRAVCYSPAGFIAVGNNGTILTSTNGETWTGTNGCRCPGSIQNLRAVTYVNGMYVVVGNLGTILTSTDARTWVCRRVGNLPNLHGVAWGQGTFVTVGNGSSIVQSEPILMLSSRNQELGQSVEIGIADGGLKPFRLMASTNLNDWVEVGRWDTPQPTNSYLQIITNVPQRFFRALTE